MFERNLPIVFVAAIALTAASHHLAARGGTPSRLSDQRPATAEAAFLLQAGQATEAEIAAAALAEKQAKDPRVKALSTVLKRDHEAARTELQALAKTKNAELTAMTVAQLAAFNRLEKLSGGDFDRAWLEQMVAEHREMRGVYSRASRSADADIKGFATRQLAALQTHLKQVQQVQGAIR
jgi:putative membrane protein